jgi:hypothetical protein
MGSPTPVIHPSSGKDDSGDSNNGHEADENEASKYDCLCKEGAYDCAVCATFFIPCSRLCLHIQYIQCQKPMKCSQGNDP